MTIQITYPNEGCYAGGRPRFEKLNDKGEIVFCTLATDEQVMWWDQLCATRELINVTNALRETMAYRS